MRPRDLIRVAGLATAALLLVTPAPAGAAPNGTLTFFPSNSIDQAAIKARTSAGCPSPADGYMAVVKGHGFPADGQIVTTPTAAGMSRTAGFDVYFAQTMKDFASDNRTTLKGRYDVAVYCIDSFLGTKFSQFTGTLTFTSPTKYKASGKDTMSSPPSGPATVAPTAVAPAPAQSAAAASSSPLAGAPEAVEPSPAQLVSAPAPAKNDGLPIGWILGGVAAVLLSFEIGRRFGRRNLEGN
ncbi:hypothetical protein [Paractinoplanes globisporus]|uniref:Secreted protein n=1 Tax=Paractinoplanes globisporus TaxID=113565 RepID=A0ABW6WQ28_9ACTN|nr:hypothetical protein [Actinoplanes globisporus]